MGCRQGSLPKASRASPPFMVAWRTVVPSAAGRAPRASIAGTATSTGHEGIFDTGSKTLFLLARSGAINSAAHAEAMLPQKHHGVHLLAAIEASAVVRWSLVHHPTHSRCQKSFGSPDCISSDMPDTS
jgi:hypothetical protein